MRRLLKLSISIILAWWIFLSHVSFMSEKNLLFIHNDVNSDYIARWYITKSINPIGIWFNINNETTTSFVVLIDKEGNYIGQSSPFYLSSWADSHLPTTKSNQFFSLGGPELESAYSISIHKRKWWDYILKYFYEVQN
ncbi:DUF6201 family protein [Fusobacterium sp.]|uniref:DUF6201 family protein n=1 Tax=Fusobacterium sp. TaxID=68766 RepID=UPI0025BFD315|nr:DUF6201 family protein [Fusobacterium sp.]MCI7224241.1 DUF6201 family protein [Fusobacterium sp.]